MQQTDILVIGGGIAGTATACYLAQYGRQVILLEQSELAAEASGLNAGTLWANGWGRTPDLSSTLSMGSLEVFKTLQLDHGYDVEFRQGGSLQAIQTEEEYAFARQEVGEPLARGYQVELLDGRDARGIESALGPRILGCLYYPQGGNANPVKTVLALASLGYSHWIWWIIRPALSRPISGRFGDEAVRRGLLFPEQGSIRVLLRAPSPNTPRHDPAPTSDFGASQAEIGNNGQESTSRAAHRRWVLPAAMAGVRCR